MKETRSEMSTATTRAGENRLSGRPLSQWHACFSHTSAQLAAFFN